MTLGHSLGIAAGALGAALAAFLAVDPLTAYPELASALAGLVAALGAISVYLQYQYPSGGGDAGSPSQVPPGA